MDELISEDVFYRALADELGLAFLADIDADILVIRHEDCLTELVSNNLCVLARLSGVAGARRLSWLRRRRPRAF